MYHNDKSACRECAEALPSVPELGRVQGLSVGGVVGVDQGSNMAADVGFVGIGSLHQAAEAAEEGVGVEGDRGADVDEVVVGLLQALFLHQLFFIQLFTRAQAGILDLNIHIRLEAGELDEVAG